MRVAIRVVVPRISVIKVSVAGSAASSADPLPSRSKSRVASVRPVPKISSMETSSSVAPLKCPVTRS